MITITIKTDNAAFEDSGYGPEVARILEHMAELVSDWDGHGGLSLPVLDLNGNKVGRLEAK